MRSPQGHAAIIQAEDDGAAQLVAPGSMRREAHAKTGVQSAQAHPFFDRSLDKGNGRSGSFPSRLLGFALHSHPME